MKKTQIEKKYIIILKSVKLKCLHSVAVKNMFEKAYSYLINHERYEDCADIKKIETEYNRETELKKHQIYGADKNVC